MHYFHNVCMHTADVSKLGMSFQTNVLANVQSVENGSIGEKWVNLVIMAKILLSNALSCPDVIVVAAIDNCC